jgi:hypothetical protein
MNVMRLLKGKGMLFGALLLLVGAMALSLLWPSGRSGRMLDGSAVVLEAVTFGKEHRSPVSRVAPLIEKLPAQVLRVLDWHSAVTNNFRVNRDIFAFWFRFRYPDRDKSVRYAIADENGFEALAVFTGGYGNYGPAGFGKSSFGAVRSFGLFPVRSNRFFLRLYEENGAGDLVRVANLAVKNSRVSAAPAWSPEPFPVSRITNGVVLTLAAVEIGVPAKGRKEGISFIGSSKPCPGNWGEYRLRVNDLAAPSVRWDLSEILIDEATGNYARVGPDLGWFRGGREKDEIVWSAPWVFWKGETAWRLRAHFTNAVGREAWMECFVRPSFKE